MKTQNNLPGFYPPSSGRNRLLTAAVLLSTLAGADAASIVFAVGTGNWSTASNWSPATVPTALDEVFIRVNRTAQVTTAVTDVTTVYLGGDGNTGTLSISGTGSLRATANIEVMRRGTYNNNSGVLNMSAGSLVVGGILYVGAGTANNTGGTGAANISGGSISGTVAIGAAATGRGTGIFSVTGSTASIGDGGLSKAFTVNAFGTLAFTLDQLGASTLGYANSTVTFNTGSTLNIDGSAYTGAGGDIVLVNGGTLTGTATNLNITGLDGYTSSVLYNQGGNGDVVLRLASIPEPGSLGSLVLGAGIIVLKRRRSQS